MLKAREKEQILLKYALAFSKLLELNFQENREGKIPRKRQRVSTLGELSIDTELRPATLSNIFLGRSNLKAITILQILKSLGRSYTEFANQFDNLSEKELAEFKSKVDNLKKRPGRPSRVR